MNALVIGGQGFIGAEIVRSLLARGANVTIADEMADEHLCSALFGAHTVKVKRATILDRECMRELTFGMDHVYHLAGKLGTSELDDDIQSAVEINVIGAVNVFSACVANDVPVVFYPSKPNVWLNTYTITKYASEQFAQLLSQQSKTLICSLRYFNAYGPHQKIGPVRKIIPDFALRAINGRSIEVFGDGEQVIDMVSSQDLGRISVEFACSSQSSVPLDCGRGIPLTVNEVAIAVNDFYGNTQKIRYLPMRRGETPGTVLVAEISQLRQTIPNLTFSDWTSSLHETLEWYAAKAHKLPVLTR